MQVAQELIYKNLQQFCTTRIEFGFDISCYDSLAN
jgi:hypothetical protein